MYSDKFSPWINWEKRNEVPRVNYPGIYIIAISDNDISGYEFNWLTEIVYIGMTNSITGLKGRLQQFDNTIIGKTGHGGADRVRFKYQNYDQLISNLYVAVSPFECSVKSNQPSDLRIMGNITKFEYDCFAQFVEEFGFLPEFNNKKTSPKYSLTIARNNEIK